MKTIQLLFKITIVLLFAFIVSFNFAVNPVMATGQFSLTCDKDNMAINGSTLSTSCKEKDGDAHQTSLNLDEYIANHDGTLDWGDKDFSKTCKNIGLAQSLSNRQLILAADCKTAAGDSYTPTEIELDAHIVNIDGNLQYE